MQRQIEPTFGENVHGEIKSPPLERRSLGAFCLTWLRRYLPLVLLLLVVMLIAGIYFGNEFWIHRYDAMIEHQAKIYRLDSKLVWSLIHEETYFRPSKIGDAGEVGLMQVTPTVAREWAKETGIQDFEQQIAANHVAFMSQPERNIQIGCWYLEKLSEKYRDVPEPEARILAAYNAGPSRVAEWNKSPPAAPFSEDQFIKQIDITSTRAYVTTILRRYRYVKQK